MLLLRRAVDRCALDRQPATPQPPGLMIPEVLGRLAIWLMQADVGLGLAVLVGLSMSVSHLFALVANRLTPRQIAVQLVLDGLVLALALLLGILFNILMIKALTGAVLHPSELLDKLGAALREQVYDAPGIIIGRGGCVVMVVAVRALRVRGGVSGFRVDPSVERRADGENCEHQHQGRAERRGEAGGERERAWCWASHDGAEVRLRSGE